MKEEQKKIPFKKLPWMYKKTYTEKSLEKKLLKKLYIPADREFVAAQFSADGEDPAKLRIHRIEYDAKDFKQTDKAAKRTHKPRAACCRCSCCCRGCACRSYV